MTPSSRDSISGWLDVLTSMLSLPEAKRVQVRDELEDHLRSRVDDLLITGVAEPEAVRIAVAELGETAELAQLISHAHSRANPRRRMMNGALILAAIAGLSVGGISWNGGGWGGAAVPMGGQVAADFDDAKEEAKDDAKSDETRFFEFEQVSTGVVLAAVAESFGLEVKYLSVDSRVGLAMYTTNFTGEYTPSGAIEALNSNVLSRRGGYVLDLDGTTIRVMTQSEYARQQIEMRIYPSPVWLSKAVERREYVNSLTNLLIVKHDLQYTSIEVIDEAIVVAATPEIHKEVMRFSAELRAMIEERHKQRRERSALQEKEWQAGQKQVQIEREARNVKAAIEFEKTVQKLQAELNTARKALLGVQEKLRIHQDDLHEETMALREENRKNGTRAKTRNSKIDRLNKSVRALKLEVEENEERYMFLRSRLLESEYAQLFAGLD